MPSGFKVFSAGSVLTASDTNNYLMEQTVMYFASASARDAAITSPERGMTVFLSDSGSLLVYYGATTGWQPPWNQPWGVPAATSGGTSGYARVYDLSGDRNTTGIITPTGGSLTFTGIANRAYQISFAGTFATDGGGLFDMTIDNGSGTAIYSKSDYAYASQPVIAQFSTFATITGSKTYRFTVNRPSGFSNTLYLTDGTLWVTDVGPNSSTAPSA